MCQGLQESTLCTLSHLTHPTHLDIGAFCGLILQMQELSLREGQQLA